MGRSPFTKKKKKKESKQVENSKINLKGSNAIQRSVRGSG
jgi:hypothetical protein